MMTKEQWKEAEESISLFTPLKFRIDGHDVTIQMQRNNMKLVFAVYVDGFIKGEWFNDMDKAPPICKKVYFLAKMKRYNSTQKRALLKLGKRTLKKMEIDIDECFGYYRSCFGSFRTLKNSWKKNCDNIEWIN